DKILRVRVLNYTSDTLALWCSIPDDKFFYRQYQIYEKSALYGTPASRSNAGQQLAPMGVFAIVQSVQTQIL
ncbi:MAG: hypothetical protein ACYTXY_08155, partial [Nostoc sp.]